MIQNRIKKCTNDLTKSQRAVAQFVLEQPEFIALHTASEVGGKIGVSETTIIRFCYQLELTGYKQLQKYIQQSIVTKESTLGTYLSANTLREEKHFAQAVMAKDVERIHSFAEQVDAKDFKKASSVLHKANTLYVLGLSSSYAAAQWTSFTLNTVRDKIELIQPDAQNFIKKISQMSENDAVLVFSFHRYYKQTIDIAKVMKKQGVQIIGITDSILAPIQKYADILFTLEQQEMSTIEMMPGIISFMNALVIGMTAENPKEFEAHKLDYEAVEGSSLFLDGGEY